MKLPYVYKSVFYVAAALALGSAACTKTDIRFGDIDGSGDPEIVYYDNYPVTLATFKKDSFITKGQGTYTLGHITDTAFGTLNAASYAEVTLPATNTVKDLDVIYDSLVLILNPSGNYYGDTLQTFPLRVAALTENVINEDEADGNTEFYNPRSFARDASWLGQANVRVKPVAKTTVSIRLSDAFGAELLNKLRLNNTDIQTTENFLRYFKGLYIGTDTTQARSIFSFTLSDSTIMRLYYRLNNPVFEARTLDFGVNSSHQFNQLTSHFSGPGLSAFTPFKTQVLTSSATGGRAFLHSNLATYIKLSFPSLLTLKELHPFVKIVRAQLVIKPRTGTYNYPYTLPPQLYLYSTDENNTLTTIQADAQGNAQNGSLYIDGLYGDKTAYTFDIAPFLNTRISEGQFSESALMLTMPTGYTSAISQRLVIGDQTVSNDVQLKLYVIGL